MTTDSSVDVDKELLPFLSSSARHDLKFIAIKYFVGKLIYPSSLIVKDKRAGICSCSWLWNGELRLWFIAVYKIFSIATNLILGDPYSHFSYDEIFLIYFSSYYYTIYGMPNVFLNWGWLFVGLSGTVPGRQFITSKQIYTDRIIELACDNVTNVVKEAIACLVNTAGDKHGVDLILASSQVNQFLDTILNSVVQKGCLLADAIAMLLSNISREEKGAQKFVDILTSIDPPTTFDQLIQVMCLVGFNQNADLNFLAPFLSNLSQIAVARQYFLDKDKCVIQRLLPFTQHESPIRRQAVSTILKNCCFDTGTV